MKNLPFKRVSSDIAAKVSQKRAPVAPALTCSTCAGAKYVRARNLPPTHRLFGQRLPCPKCHLMPVKTRLAKSWPITEIQADFGRTPFVNRPEYPQIAVAWRTINAFIADLPDYRLLMIHGPSGVGKSHLLLIIRHQTLAAGISTIYVTGVELQKRIQQFDDDHKRHRDWQDLVNVKVLLIDDLDGISGSKIYPKLIELLNERRNGKRATAMAFKDASCCTKPIISRAEAYQDWSPIKEKGFRSGWLSLTKVKDGRPLYSDMPRPKEEQ